MSFICVAPEHPILNEAIVPQPEWAAVQSYQQRTSQLSDDERSEGKDGVWSGVWAINPINSQRVKVMVSAYVLLEHGTGAVMGVPAHDTRDFGFAQQHQLPILQVISPPHTDSETGSSELPYTEYGVLINSGPHTGLSSTEAAVAILSSLSSRSLASAASSFRLRDWLVRSTALLGHSHTNHPLPTLRRPARTCRAAASRVTASKSTGRKRRQPAEQRGVPRVARSGMSQMWRASRARHGHSGYIR